MTQLSWVVLELAEADWSDLDARERSTFQAWLEGARAQDLYLLLREARQRDRRRRRSSSPTFAAVRALNEDD